MLPVDQIKLIFFSVFSIAGLLFLFIGIKEGLKTYKIILYGIETKGIVIDIYKRPMKLHEKTSGSFAPVVQFQTKNAENITYYSTTFTNFNLYQIGQEVNIWYLPDNPQEVSMEGKENWILPISFLIFGLAMTLIFLPTAVKLIFRYFQGSDPTL